MHLIDAPSAHLPVREPRRVLPADIRLGVVLVSAALLGVAACGSTGSGGSDAVSETPVYVLNLHDAEQGRADRRPRDLVVSEFTALNGVTWHSWGPTRAAGEGRLSGSWCLPGCADTPYDATVTLSGVVPVRGKGYFTRYEITADVPPDLREQADLRGVIPTPESTVG
ncbi:hypothetical protein [Sphaerimonospora mesophila]|uniref:hypothetical protein n=1 Tax=Sphaerimonospora mesophila TaxID=37483 RepID=UPI0006E468EF